MFFGRQTRQEISLNTSFFTSYSETCLLQVGGWNRQLSISFKPCTGTDANGVRTYAEDKSQYIITSLTADNAIAMIEGFEKYILPAIKTGEEASISVVMGSNDQRKVITLKYDGTDAYISVSTGLNESGVATNTITHKFNKKNYLVGYKPTTGGPGIIIRDRSHRIVEVLIRHPQLHQNLICRSYRSININK